jgi:cytolysin-activating lysine-acyltransferase
MSTANNPTPSQSASQVQSNVASAAQLETVKKELTKLPALGPILWLYARDPNRRFTFVADLDWRLLPPLVLNQHCLFHKDEVPWAYFSWAMVSPEVDQRLRSTTPVLAPHEWQSGNIAWLIDVVWPYGEDQDLLKQAIGHFAPGKMVNALVFDNTGRLVARRVQG